MSLKRKFSKWTCFLLLSSMMFGCSFFETDTIEIATSPEVTKEFPLIKLWNKKMQGEAQVIPYKFSFIYSKLSPISENNIVFAAGRFGEVSALDSQTGKVIWKTNLSDKSGFVPKSAMLAGGITIDENNLYVGSEQAHLFVLNKKTGKQNFDIELKGALVSSPASIDGKIVVNTANGHLQAFDIKSGKEVWDTQLTMPVLTIRGQSTPVSAFGAVVLGNNTGYVSAYFSKDGQLIWQQRISQPAGSNEIDKLNDVISTPVVESKTIYAVGYNGSLVSLDLGNGSIIWNKPFSSTKDITVTDNRIYALDKLDALYSIDKNGGSTIWKQSSFLNRQLTPPVVYKNYLITADYEGFVYLIDKNSGSIVSKKQVTRVGFSSKAVVVNDTVILQAKNGTVYAFGTSK